MQWRVSARVDCRCMSRRQRPFTELRDLGSLAEWPERSTWHSSISPTSGETRIIDLLARAIDDTVSLDVHASASLSCARRPLTNR